MVIYIYIDPHFITEIAKMSAHKHGGAKKDMHKFPRIIDFLEVHHKNVYDIICDLALEHSLVPRRGGGITFLVPDAAYTKKIRKQVDGDDPEEATDMIYSLIILDNLPDVASWKEIKDDVPNLLGKKIKVHGITESKVSFNNGGSASAVVCPKFKAFARSGNSKRNNMSVWNLTGEIDYKNADATNRGFEPKRGSAETLAKIRGSAEFIENDKAIKIFVLETERQEQIAIQNHINGKSPYVESIKLRVLCNYANALQRKIKNSSDPDHKLAVQHFETLKHICDIQIMGGIEAAFYLVFSCRDTRNFRGATIKGLHNTEFLSKIMAEDALKGKYTCSLSEFTKLLNPSTGGNDAKKIELFIDRISTGVRLSTVESLKQAYKEYVDKMPSTVLRLLFTELGYEFKILVDQFKFDCFLLWKTWLSNHNISTLLPNYRKFLDSLKSTYGNIYPHIMITQPDRQLHLNSWKSVNTFAGPEKSYLVAFMSPDGMWRESRSRKTGSSEYTAEHIYGSGEHDSVSKHSINEIRNYFDKHGKLPPELRGL